MCGECAKFKDLTFYAVEFAILKLKEEKELSTAKTKNP